MAGEDFYTSEQRREMTLLLASIRERTNRVRTGLDIGFAHAGISQTFRQKLGGYWVTVELTQERCARVAAALGPDTVLCTRDGVELPFEDRQFDVIVVASGFLNGDVRDAARIRECHRVLSEGGVMFCTVPCGDAIGAYTERSLFLAMKDGFDVLSVHYTDRTVFRFWTRGKRMMVCARRKGWRGQRATLVTAHTPVSDAMLLVRR